MHQDEEEDQKWAGWMTCPWTWEMERQSKESRGLEA